MIELEAVSVLLSDPVEWRQSSIVLLSNTLIFSKRSEVETELHCVALKYSYILQTISSGDRAPLCCSQILSCSPNDLKWRQSSIVLLSNTLILSKRSQVETELHCVALKYSHTLQTI
ncbi:hypothetical protein PoB_006200500 [Plakobranchus ocellatus]|uniref:Clathrin/coatomer adaptor adaptin-like N-terminal domain-containing protein n=1 Tax=Plakobranchus ocellatus TaxID=259542 RepID=A0AAV4CUE7_9GAST|nr:hypothetical protein PoB_006200500 [Plakobranchus ocellatus]